MSCSSGAEPEATLDGAADKTATAAVSDDAVDSGGTLTEEHRTAIATVADVIVAEFGDSDLALAAVLLAADRGHSIYQIIEAGLARRLGPDGTILETSGATAGPRHSPVGLLVNDLIGEGESASSSSVFEQGAEVRLVSQAQSQDEADEEVGRIPVSALVTDIDRKFGGSQGGLVVTIQLLVSGYDLEQIVLGVLTNQRFDGNNLVDEDGDTVKPNGRPTLEHRLEVADEKDSDELLAWLDAQIAEVQADTTSDEPSAPAEEPADEASDDEQDDLTRGIAQAVGVYRLDEASLRSAIEGAPGIISFDSSEGVIVIDDEGVIAGDFTYLLTTVFDESTARVTFEGTFGPAEGARLDPAEVRLLFDGELVLSGNVEPQDGTSPYDLTPNFTQGQASVDPESGILELTVDDGQQVVAIEFRR